MPQGCELTDGTLIAYSLGNFVFPAHSSPYMRRHAPWTARSFLLLAEIGRDGVRSFERVPFEIAAPPEERPMPLGGRARDEMLSHLTALDGHLCDEAFVRRVWRDAAKRRLESYLQEVLALGSHRPSRWSRLLARVLGGRSVDGMRRIDIERVIDDYVPRLCLTAENLSWMAEVLEMGRERWQQRNAEASDPLHRPHYRFSKR